MGAPGRDLLCPTCGQPLGPVPPPSSQLVWVKCRHCGALVPLAPATPLPPRFTWEVYPGLYPSQPPIVRPRFRWRSIIVPALIAIAIVAAAIAGGTAYYGWAGSQSATYTVSGTVNLSDGAPAAGAQVAFMDESGSGSTTVGLNGAFSIAGVPTGGVDLNITDPGYAPLFIITFVSPVYDAGSQGLNAELARGTVSNETVVTLSPYGDFSGGASPLANFQTYVGAASTLAALVAIVGGVAGAILRRSDRPALGIVGGAAGVGVLLALIILPVGTVFPLLLILGLGAAGLGAFTFALAWVEMIQTGDPPARPDRA